MKNKKILSLLMILAMIVSIAPGVFAAADTCDFCGTTLNEVFHNDATCGANGTTLYKCPSCEQTKYVDIPATGEHIFVNGMCVCGQWEEKAECTEHNYQVIKELAATCAEGGYVWTKCSVCGDEKNYETDPATGKHGETRTDIVEASCSKEGISKVICKVCGETISEETLPVNDNHAYYNGKCLLCGEEEPVACEHDFEVVKELAPTCAEAGYVWTRCSICSWEENYETDPATGVHGETYVDIFEASCSKTGTSKVICKVCGETVSEEVLPTNNNHAYYNGKCLLCGAEETVACEHNYEIVKEEAATCGESGYVWTKCSKCGWEKNYETDPIADAHDYEVVKKLDATCLEGGYVWTRCSICGWEKNYETDPVSNIHVVGENGKCTTCGREMAEFVCEHENSTLLNTVEPDCYYTGVELWKCDDCNATYTVELPATGVHAFENGVCTVCGIDEPAEEPEETPDKEPEETPDEKPEETPGKQPEQTPDEKPVETPDQEPEETPNQEDSSAELDNVPKTGSFLLEWLFALIFG